MLIRTKTSTRYYLVIRGGDDDGRFLRHTGAGWGPEYLPTDDIFEAVHACDEHSVLELVKRTTWSVVVKEATVRTTIEM